MRLNVFGVLRLAALGASVLVPSAWSHHAHGNYTEETKDFQGVITEIHWLAPHSFIYINVTNANGETQLWSLEGGGNRVAFEKLDKEGKGLKVGDKITTRCHPLRDGSPGCLLGFIKHPDGTVRDYDEGGKEASVPGF